MYLKVPFVDKNISNLLKILFDEREKVLIVLAALLFSIRIAAQWKPAGNKIKTEWAQKIDPENVLPEYPRPMMERPEWKNLNGLWEYAIRPRGKSFPQKFDGKILVPFAAESSLSGVMAAVGAKNELWYRTAFDVPANWEDRNILLHFGAVDWKTDIWINDIKVGSHEGGYTPFSFNITPFLGDGEQQLIVKVWDPTDEGPQPRGKQVKEPKGIWYTPVTGIWQTVWLEPVSQKRIAGPQWQNHSYFDGSEFKRTDRSEAIYRKEWQGIMDYLFSHPSIVS